VYCLLLCEQGCDLQDILETWRLRTPNEWEPLSAWADVLTWRNAIYNVVINAFKNLGEMAPHLHQLGYRDKAWSVPVDPTLPCSFLQSACLLGTMQPFHPSVHCCASRKWHGLRACVVACTSSSGIVRAQVCEPPCCHCPKA
jgi:hypothetical protein